MFDCDCEYEDTEYNLEDIFNRLTPEDYQAWDDEIKRRQKLVEAGQASPPADIQSAFWASRARLPVCKIGC